MENEPVPPEKPAIPPPDLPIPPPGEKPPGPAPVKVHIKEAGTSEDDEPEGPGLAPFNARVLATVIDAVVAVGLQMAAMWILPSFAGKIAWLLGIAYLITRDSLPFLGGQSVGKKAMNLRVVTRKGQPLTGNWNAALIRNGVLLIPFFALIELFVLLNREDKPEHGLRLGDEWAKTKVVVEPAKPAADDGESG
jgi:uncharacterized RDD family membrane protein YckC